MVTLRFQRIGRKKQPYFRLIAQDKRKDQWDKSLEILGSRNPRTKEVELNKERIEYWLSVGAQPTNSVHNLLVTQGIIKGDKAKSVTISNKRAEKIAAKKGEDKPEEAAKEEKKEEIDETKEEKTEEVKAETPKEEEKKEEAKEEATAEEKKKEKKEEKEA